MSSKTCNYRLRVLEEGRKEDGDRPKSSASFPENSGAPES